MEVKYLNLSYWYNQILKLLDEPIEFSFYKIFIFWREIYLYITIPLVLGIIFLFYKINRLNKKRIDMYIDAVFEEKIPEERALKWQEIKNHMDSNNSSEWKMAVIEADALVGEIIERIGYRGETLGEKLKNIEPSDLDSLQDVWEAHKLRNRIAHEHDNVLVRKDAEDAIAKYEKVLKELKYI